MDAALERTSDHPPSRAMPMSRSPTARPAGARRPGGWRALGVFWVAVLALAGGGVAVLEHLGPPTAPIAPMPTPSPARHPAAPPPAISPQHIAATHPAPPGAPSGSPAPAAKPAAPTAGAAHPPSPTAPTATPTAPRASGAAAPAPVPTTAAGSATGAVGPAPTAGAATVAQGGNQGGNQGGAPTAAPAASVPGAAPPGPAGQGPIAAPATATTPITAPLSALAEAAPGHPGRTLPRIGPDGLAPMHAYAARFDPADHHPRVALLLAGIGLDPGASGDAIRDLPAAISLAISPYAPDPTALLAAARAAGHEYLLSLPMEPARYPLNDPGPRALLTSHTPAQNQAALIWALSRFPGYVGVTGALGAMDGERFAGASEDMDPVLRRLAARGLLYVDPRPGAARLPFAWGRAADVTIDRADDPAAIVAALDRLDRIASRKGSALGVVGAPLPNTLTLLAAWAQGLPARGLVLTPASALAAPPPASSPASPPPASPPAAPSGSPNGPPQTAPTAASPPK